jgi:excisionase family DNA binding protein
MRRTTDFPLRFVYHKDKKTIGRRNGRIDMDRNEFSPLNGNRLLKAVEVAQILNISRAFAYQLMKRGVIRTVFIAGARRVQPEDLTTFIEANLYPPAQNQANQ